ncbi:UDP-N-acetylglucosamine diphosphorylase/glucosamine-1-phosphate N-acetyltransferase [Hydrogenovibrio sp. SC-1]|uniref:bifunctional UDP-N-acetylglucosamine diphosphorylase/glucosamine-1-phosphate N-acetyltransferase GlmU n=1 Tax=Hydrogenovibrio sp. SC-1 TaxID=2065820 RepID=UPI000C7B23E8|nr:bifunctional UDP-N-acetylglucosamine diphosphorylase/glucosamine-1-phosphate N-acetyltransferase GlmU [Hydrogenovibrio sp. SC-1]PLA74681.1 UDP-N-acetylglucosamine diphosphorylase/glucosamine-1-phosphate N-acetyltransferase [Hydrogenovibrio sp. SC-1]
MSLKILVLAAGKGTRMRSHHPKVLQPLAQKPLLAHVVETAENLTDQAIITIVGHGAEQVKSVMGSEGLIYIEQEEQLGTGHAVQVAESHFDDNDTVLILYGDVPLTRKSTLENLISKVDEQHPLALLTIELADSSGYGRIVRNAAGAVTSIVEQKDASEAQKQIKEINTGMLAAKGGSLRQWLSQLSNDNAQGEYYLTDIVSLCVDSGCQVATSQPDSEIEVLGVNDKRQLQGLERDYQALLADDLMSKGVTLVDSSRLDIRGHVDVGMDVSIDVNVIFEGKVSLGDNVTIGANCVIRNAHIAANTVIHPFSHIDGAQLDESCDIGPYARLRPGTTLAQSVKIGNFVETKNAQIATGSKVNHLSYIGDTKMGSNVNIGAGTITCNYDGTNKHQTLIGDDVFVGSDTQLVAPVTIEKGATIGAGSTITKTAPANTLTLSRSKQLSIATWQRPQKK